VAQLKGDYIHLAEWTSASESEALGISELKILDILCRNLFGIVMHWKISGLETGKKDFKRSNAGQCSPKIAEYSGTILQRNEPHKTGDWPEVSKSANYGRPTPIVIRIARTAHSAVVV
jgi:hypothetical protein